MAEHVILRRFYPADVTMPDGRQLTNALAIITQDRLHVWSAAAGTPTLELDTPYRLDVPLPHRAQLEREVLSLPTDVGDVGVKVGAGCGCGAPSVLRGFQPWSPELSR